MNQPATSPVPASRRPAPAAGAPRQPKGEMGALERRTSPAITWEYRPNGRQRCAPLHKPTARRGSPTRRPMIAPPCSHHRKARGTKRVAATAAGLRAAMAAPRKPQSTRCCTMGPAPGMPMPTARRKTISSSGMTAITASAVAETVSSIREARRFTWAVSVPWPARRGWAARLPAPSIRQPCAGGTRRAP